MPKHSIYDFDRLYRRTVTDKAGATSPHYLRLGRVGAGRLRVLTHVTVENTESTYDKVRIGIENLGNVFYLDELLDPVEGELAVSRSDILLGEGDVFFAKCEGCGEDEPLILTAIGWENEL